jgi:error-prone DNA polymerase
MAAVEAEMLRPVVASDEAVHGAAESRSTRPVMTQPPGNGSPVGGRARVYASGFEKSPYVDIGPAGAHPGSGAPRKLWHSSPGSSGG